MAKKTLNEAVVRRFQKLANVAPINEMYMNEEEVEADMAPAGDDMGAPEGEADADLDAEAPMDDEMGDAMAEVPESEIQDAKAGLESALDLLNQILPGDAGEGEEEMGAMDDMEPMAGEEEEDADLESDIMEALRGVSYEPSQSEIVNEVAQRVARRLKTAK